MKFADFVPKSFDLDTRGIDIDAEALDFHTERSDFATLQSRFVTRRHCFVAKEGRAEHAGDARSMRKRRESIGFTGPMLSAARRCWGCALYETLRGGGWLRISWQAVGLWGRGEGRGGRRAGAFGELGDGRR